MVTIQVTTTQGAVLDILLGVTVAPLTPVLAANPGYLDSGMVVGAQSLVSFTVVNNGGAPSGDLQVNLPATSYMSLVSPATIPSLAPGASSTVTVELTPPSDLPLEEYTGTIGIGGAQTGISVPFTFTAITTATGNVQVLVDDDYTFEEAGSPRVQGATVNLLNPYDNTDIVETGVTDASGAVTFTNVPAGPYDLQVQATGHSSYENSFTVVPGITNSDEVFIAEQFVTYTWNVVQTTIQDTYQIQLQTTFATDVPAPVVTITAPASIPTSARSIVDLQRHDHQPRPDRRAGRDPEHAHRSRVHVHGAIRGYRRGTGREFRRSSHHGDPGGSPIAYHQRRRHGSDRESGGTQPGWLRYRVNGVRGLFQYGDRGHPGAALDADGNARQQPGSFPVFGLLPGRARLQLERHARGFQR